MDKPYSSNTVFNTSLKLISALNVELASQSIVSLDASPLKPTADTGCAIQRERVQYSIQGQIKGVDYFKDNLVLHFHEAGLQETEKEKIRPESKRQ